MIDPYFSLLFFFFSCSYRATYRRQFEMNDDFNRYVSNIKKAYAGRNEVGVQLASMDPSDSQAMQEYSEGDDADEVRAFPPFFRYSSRSLSQIVFRSPKLLFIYSHTLYV